MAKPSSSAAAPAKRSHGKPTKPTPAGKPGKAAASPQPSKSLQKKPHFDHQPTPRGVPSEAVTAMATRMAEKGLAWYDAVKPLKAQAPPPAPPSKKRNKQDSTTSADATIITVTDGDVESTKRQAQALLEQEQARFDAKKQSKLSSDDKYLATMMSKGTLADRVAALTLTIQASPFHRLSRLHQLITMATKKARRESMMAVESLKDLFINNLLPDDRKLLFFHQQPLVHPHATDAHRAVWWFEHCLKTAFAQLVGVLSSGMQDAVDNHKRACIRAASALLQAKPEQEAVLLGMLVNKLGDPDRKVAAYIHQTLQELLRAHPVMKRVVVDEVERLLTRAQVSDRTKYNAVLFLNQILLTKSDTEDAALAAHLIKVFFALFSKEVHGAELADQQRRRKAQHKAAKKHALGKKSARSHGLPTDGAAMDRKLLSALLTGVNRAFPYAKATAAELQREIDTLFKVVRLATHFATSVHAMMLLFQVMHATHSVSDRFYTALYEKLLDPTLRETSKHTLFLNLVFKALKADVSPPRTAAFVKRLLQLTSVMPPAFACAVLFLLAEVAKVKPTMRALFDQSEAGAGADDVEQFTDADVFDPNDLEEDKEEEDDEEEGVTDDAEQSAKVLAAMFGTDAAVAEPTRGTTTLDKAEERGTKTTSGGDDYDWQKRNPLYAGAERACAWELHHLLHHFHPSVQSFARQLVAGTGIQYAGDPLVDFTLHAFFEKFMNKKPKHRRREDPATDGAGKSWTFVPINSEALLQEASVDASDQFFYKFFKERAQREAAHPSSSPKKKSKKRGDRDGDAFSDDGDSDEDSEMEAFAQELAEGMLQDGDMDEEDPETATWSGPEDEEDEEEEEEEGGELEEEDDEEAQAFVGGDSDDDEENGEEDNSSGEEEEEEDDDEEDEEDGFDFDAMDGALDLPKAAKQNQKGPPTGSKRKATFADADDYESIVREAMAGKVKSKKPRKH